MITDEKLDKMLKSALKEEADRLEVSDRVKKELILKLEYMRERNSIRFSG